VAEQHVLSKAEGAAWAEPRLPPELAAIAAAAAAEYSGSQPTVAARVTGAQAHALARWIERQFR
jgi:hypothetical protein